MITDVVWLPLFFYVLVKYKGYNKKGDFLLEIALLHEQHGGGAEIRTRVPKHYPNGIYMFILLFVFSYLSLKVRIQVRAVSKFHLTPWKRETKVSLISVALLVRQSAY